jgi:hypothetical protein
MINKRMASKSIDQRKKKNTPLDMITRLLSNFKALFDSITCTVKELIHFPPHCPFHSIITKFFRCSIIQGMQK